MANFEYIALDAKGEETTGVISASDEADAITQLRKTGLYPTQVEVAAVETVPRPSQSVP